MRGHSYLEQSNIIPAPSGVWEGGIKRYFYTHTLHFFHYKTIIASQSYQVNF